MSKALICGKWELPLNFGVSDESSVSTHKRSYGHFVATQPELVAAKCAATNWLLNILDDTQEYSSREYFAGVGITTRIVTGKFKIRSQALSDEYLGCVDQLNSVDWGVTTLVRQQDARKAMLEEDDSDLKFYDFPHSSILHLQKKWSGFQRAFDSKPKLVVWTDTAVAYHMAIHGKRYAAAFGIDKVESHEDYVAGMSSWLYSQFGYTIARAAFRANNAVYFAAVPGEVDGELEYFKIKESQDSFKIL